MPDPASPSRSTEVLRAADAELVATVADAPGVAVDLAGEPRTVALGDVPRWIVGSPLAGGTVGLVVVTEADETRALRVDGPDVTEGRLTSSSAPGLRPPVLRSDGDGSLGLVPAPADAASHAPVLALPDGGLAYVDDDRALVVAGAAGEERHPLDLLPDTWIVPVDEAHVAVLAGPTEAYGHGVLGDGIEASEVLVVATVTGEVTTRIAVDGVVEGVRPWVGALPGIDGPVLVVTVSDDEGGADVVAYDLSGGEVASTGPIGTGNRWRHVIAVDGEVGLVEVVTPHLGKELRVARPAGDRLTPTVALPGTMSSHAIGSRDLDEAKLVRLAGRPVVIGPGPDRDTLVVVAADDGAVLVDRPLPARWATNLAVVDGPDGGAVAVGLEDGNVLVWSASR